MKNPLYLILLLAAGLAIMSYNRVTSAPVAPNQPQNKTEAAAASAVNENPVLECIHTRTSVRSYSSKAIKPELIDTLLYAAMSAPSAVNKQPWRFVVIRDKNVLAEIGKKFDNMSMMKEAAAAILVCGDMYASLMGEGREMWAQDASAATENLLLAAHASGLGAVWCGIYPIQERVRAFTKIFRLPKGIVPFCCVALGYPAGQQTPKDKWKPSNIHQGTWTGEPALIQ